MRAADDITRISASDKRVSKIRRMREANEALKRVFYESAFTSLRSSLKFRILYDHKRPEGKKHTKALSALARRRVNVSWAMLRDGTPFKAQSQFDIFIVILLLDRGPVSRMARTES